MCAFILYSYQGESDIFWQCFKTLLKHKDKKILQFTKLQVVSQFELGKKLNHTATKKLAEKVNIIKKVQIFPFLPETP